MIICAYLHISAYLHILHISNSIQLLCLLVYYCLIGINCKTPCYFNINNQIYSGFLLYILHFACVFAWKNDKPQNVMFTSTGN